MKVHGITVTGVTKENPKNSLPKFVKDEAEARGYGDATQPLSLFVTAGDVQEAISCAAQGDGSSCVMAQAGKRIGARAIYFFRTTVWADFGEGPIVRFSTSKGIYRNVIEPFDRGDFDGITTGIYHLMPASPSMRLDARRKSNASQGKKPRGIKDGSRGLVSHAHTERVVMASRAS